MGREASPRTKWLLLAWSGIVALACAVYVAGISHESLCYDEVIVDAIARHPLGEIIGLLRYDNHPPLYYLLIWAVQRLLGSSEWALRSVTVTAAIGLVALGAGPVRRLLGDRVAFLYAGVVLSTPAFLVYAHEARMYLPATLAVTAAALHGALAVRDARMRDWVWFGVASLAAAYLHYYALIAVFFANAFVVGWTLLRRRDQARRALVTGGLVGLAYLPWLARVASQAMAVQRGGFWITPVSLEGVVLALLRPFTYKEIVPGVRWWMWAGLTLWLVLIAWGVALAWRRRARQDQAFGALLLTVYLGTAAATIGLSLVFVPVFFFRYMIVCAGGLALLVSMGLAALPGAWLRWGALAAIVLVNAPTLRDVYTREFNYGMRTVARHLGDKVAKGDLVVTSESFSLGPALHYFPQAEHYYADNTHEERWGQILNVLTPPLHYKQGLTELLAARRSFWYVTCSIGLARDVADILGDEGEGWEEERGSARSWSAPYSWCSYSASRWVKTGRTDERKGTLRIHLTGLKPGGSLFLNVFDRTPIDPRITRPVRGEMLNVSGPELTVRVGGLERKGYAVLAIHDVNGNQKVELDAMGFPSEGMATSYLDRLPLDLGPGATPEPVPFEQLAFPLTRPVQPVELRMFYPPRFTAGPATGSAGTLTVRVMGVQEGGFLVVLLHDRGPIDPGAVYRMQRLPVTAGAMLARFEGLAHGEYAVTAFHDRDGDGVLGRGEAVRVLNAGQARPDPTGQGLATFDAVKLPFREAERTVEVRLEDASGG